MDNASMIVEALAMGAQTGLTEALKLAVGQLADAVRRRLSKAEAQEDVNVLTRYPNNELRDAVRGHLESSSIATDTEVLELAQYILQGRSINAIGDGAVAAETIAPNAGAGGTNIIGGQNVRSTTTNHYGSAPAAPAWGVRHVTGGQFLLTNCGDGTAYDVSVMTTNVVRFDPRGAAASTWQPGESHDFLALGANKTPGTPEVLVTYVTTEGGPELAWRSALVKD